MHLDPATALGPAFGLCKLPIAAGKGTGNRSYDIVPGRPDDSILVHRLESTIPDVMMPEIGRALRHTEAVSMIRDWVLELDGGMHNGLTSGPRRASYALVTELELRATGDQARKGQ